MISLWIKKSIHQFKTSIIFVFLTFPIYCKSQETIGIFTYKADGMQPWDPDHFTTGGGSEEAVIFMSQELAKLGYQVIVFADPPEHSAHSSFTSNPRFIRATFIDQFPLDIAISWRVPTNAHWLKTRANQVYFWPHDTCSYPLEDWEIDAFDDVLWLSNWQRNQWISINPKFAKFETIFGNGIDLNQFEQIQERDSPHTCIYGSNYARGLEVLLDIWPIVKQEVPDAQLDIYYGWEHWGLLSPKKEAKLRAQLLELASLNVHEHGRVSHKELNQAYGTASLWTYPCIGLETFCITALRAQFAGAIPVIIEGSALIETVQHGFKCSKPEEFCALLIHALQSAKDISLKERKKMQEFISEHFTWEKIAKKWKERFSRQ